MVKTGAMELMIQLPADFPLNDVETIGRRLSQSGCLAPGYIPAEIGMLEIPALKYSEMEGIETVILPDRNIVSRIATIAKTAARRPLNDPAQLELQEMLPAERTKALLDWMIDDFFLAGPAALFASMYFAPKARRRNLIKQLRSADREKAIEGAKNAAWDMTYLSSFARRSQEGEQENRRYVFATADKNLAKIAPVLMVDAEDPAEFERVMISSLVDWWDHRDARLIAETLATYIEIANNRSPPGENHPSDDPIGDWIAAGERRLRDWQG